MNILNGITALVEKVKAEISTYGTEEASVATVVAGLLTGHAATLASTVQAVVTDAETVVDAIPAPAVAPVAVAAPTAEAPPAAEAAPAAAPSA